MLLCKGNKSSVHIKCIFAYFIEWLFLLHCDIHNFRPTGLNDCNIDGSALVRREVVWNVPAKYDKSTLNSDGSSSGGNTVVVFPLEACCHLALTKDNVTVKGCGISVPLTHLVPDVLLMDLPSELKIDHGEFQFNPKDPATYLGKGASGESKLLVASALIVQL